MRFVPWNISDSDIRVCCTVERLWICVATAGVWWSADRMTWCRSRHSYNIYLFHFRICLSADARFCSWSEWFLFPAFEKPHQTGRSVCLLIIDTNTGKVRVWLRDGGLHPTGTFVLPPVTSSLRMSRLVLIFSCSLPAWTLHTFSIHGFPFLSFLPWLERAPFRRGLNRNRVPAEVTEGR